MNIKDYVKNCKVKFLYYRDGELWYEVIGGPKKFEFPVPVHDRGEIGSAIFLAEDKALLFMRYIRKHMKYLEEAKQTQFNSM